VAVLALVISYWSLVIPSVAAAPALVVVSVQPTRVADLVMLDGGFDAGLRQGMVCRVTRGPTEIAEVLLVELRPACSAALILRVAPRQSIRAGDLARIKILKT
ncbi:MAG: hypothetical protein AAB543_02235, partial [Pseudomonadota bacterium]